MSEVMITLGIIAVVAAMSIPSMMQNAQDQQNVARLQKFVSNLEQSIKMWKLDVGCNADVYTCIANENLADDDDSAFENTIGKYIKISEKSLDGYNSVSWLPDDTLNYYGNSEAKTYGKVAHTGSQHVVYLLQDGTTMSLDFSRTGFAMYVDVNGKKKPNRIGKDVFPLTVGFKRRGKDIYYFAFYESTGHNTTGLCPLLLYTCDAENVDPTVGNGASPTAYVMLHKKLPDYKALSQTVSGFKP